MTLEYIHAMQHIHPNRVSLVNNHTDLISRLLVL